MNVLAINKDQFQLNELKEFFGKMDSKIYTAKTIREAIKKIIDNQIAIVIIDINSIADIGLIKYINDNFPNVRAFLTVENQLEEAISVFKNGSYKLLSNPMSLQELKEILKN